MTPLQRLAKLALVYLARTKLEGAEVPTYVEVSNWLNSLSEPMTEPPPADTVAAEKPGEPMQ